MDSARGADQEYIHFIMSVTQICNPIFIDHLQTQIYK